MGFWSDIFRAVNPFAKEDLSSPEAREKKAWKAASAMYYLQGPRHDYRNMLRIALQQAAKSMQKPGPHQKAWRQKYGFLKKYEYALKHETDRAFRDAGGLPRDIDDRAKYLVVHNRGELAQQYPPRNYQSFSSYSPQFIRKY